MFQTDIGPTGVTKGYLRPESAQGNIDNIIRKSVVFFNLEKILIVLKYFRL